jgi:c-di-AMP phosphodiesterase-like protein
MKFVKNLRFSGKIVLVLICILLIATFLLFPYSAVFMVLSGCISIAGTLVVFSFFTKKNDELSRCTSLLIKLIKKANTVYIMGHKRPDFDSLGAAAGLFAIAKSENKECYIVSNKKPKALLKLYTEMENEFEDQDVFMPINKAEVSINEKLLVIIADANCTKMLADENILKNASNIAVIDHHATQTDINDKTKLLYIDTTSSSTSEMVTLMIENSEDVPITKIEAIALLSGIIVDTNHFSINADRRTMRAAAYLLDKGADIKKIRSLFRVDENLMQFKAKTVESAIHLKPDILISKCECDCEEAYVAASQAANDLLDIDGIEASFVLYSVNGKVYVSGRSCGKIDMNKLLSHVGGGGHATMAGAQFESENIDEAQTIIENIVNDIYKEEYR